MEDIISNIKERILQIADYKGIARSKFCVEIGSTYGNFTGKSKKTPINSDVLGIISSKYKDISTIWLLTGEGEMLKNNSTNRIDETNEDRMIKTDRPEEGIPLIPISAMAGYGSGDICVMYHDCDRYVVPMLREAEFLISVKGDSMQPTYRSGDIVGCKRIPLSDVIYQPNKVYILDTVEGALLKRVRPQENDNLLIISDNPDYDRFELRQDQIHSVALVVGLIRAE